MDGQTNRTGESTSPILADALKRIGSMHVVVYPNGEHRIESHDGWSIALNVDPELVHLLAAAPDLLNALRGLIDYFGEGFCRPGYEGLREEALEALAKAEGRS